MDEISSNYLDKSTMYDIANFNQVKDVFKGDLNNKEINITGMINPEFQVKLFILINFQK